MYPCGIAKESRTHNVGECDMYNEERHVLEEEVRKIDECGMERFSTLLQIIVRKRLLPHNIDGGHKRRNRKGT